MRTLSLLLALCISVSAVPIQIDFEGVSLFSIAYDADLNPVEDSECPYVLNYNPGDVFTVSVYVDTRDPGFDITGTKESENSLFYEFDIISAPELISFKDSDAGFEDYSLEYSYGYGVVGDVTKSLIHNCGVAEYADPDKSDVKYLYDFFIDKTNVWGYLQTGDQVIFGETIILPEAESGGVESFSYASLTVTNVIRFVEPPATNVSEPSQEIMVFISVSVFIPVFLKKHEFKFRDKA